MHAHLAIRCCCAMCRTHAPFPPLRRSCIPCLAGTVPGWFDYVDRSALTQSYIGMSSLVELYLEDNRLTVCKLLCNFGTVGWHDRLIPRLHHFSLLRKQPGPASNPVGCHCDPAGDGTCLHSCH